MAAYAGILTSVSHMQAIDALGALIERAEHDGEGVNVTIDEIDAALMTLRDIYSQADSEQKAAMAAALGPLRSRRDDLASGRAPDLHAALTQMNIGQLRGMQPKVIGALDEGENVVAVMATGAGKSLCYQAPALYRPGITVVVSPLIALMSDQLRRLTDAGVRAGMLNSQQDPDTERRTLMRLAAGELRIVLCAPERLHEAGFMNAMRRNRIGLLAVDEAHCVVEWGDDFRPEYQRIGEWRAAMGAQQTLALTASATPDTARAIAERLGITDATHLRGEVDRPNIRLDVRMFSGSGQRAPKMDELIAALRRPDGLPAIIYAGTRNNAKSLARDLDAHGFRAGAYHAGMEPAARANAQRDYMDGATDVMCATNAFGMGVDKADVRTVVHWQTPGSMEAYYQEVGRAGRDGKPARAYLFASSGDEGRLSRQNDRPAPSEERVAQVHAAWHTGAQIPPADDDIDPENPGSLETALLLRAGALEWRPAIADTMMLTAPEAQLTEDQLDQIDAWLGEAHERRWARLDAILAFTHRPDCRRVGLLSHFEAPTPTVATANCCDICDPYDPAPEGLGDNNGAGVDPERWRALCEWRAETAGADAAVTMPTAVMGTVAAAWPRSRDALAGLDGIGPLLLDRHAEDLLEITTGSRDGELSDSERLRAEREALIVRWRDNTQSVIADEAIGRLAEIWPQHRDDLVGIPGVRNLARPAARELIALCREQAQ